MDKASSKNVPYYLLLFSQVVITFILGIFGNKASEFIKITPGSLLLGIGVFILLSFITTIALLRYQGTKQVSSSSAPAYSRSPVAVANPLSVNRIVTVLPFGIFLGLIIIPICLLFSPEGYSEIALRFFPFSMVGGVWSYEIIAGIVVLVILYRFSAHKRDRMIILALSLGLGIGISSAILILRPYQNPPLDTMFLWISAAMFAGLVIRSNTVIGLLKDVRLVLGNITQER